MGARTDKGQCALDAGESALCGPGGQKRAVRIWPTEAVLNLWAPLAKGMCWGLKHVAPNLGTDTALMLAHSA